MPIPDRSSFNVQVATLQSLLVASHRVTESYFRLVSKQQRTLAEKSSKRRADDDGVFAFVLVSVDCDNRQIDRCC